ncbi:hypothetical protein ACFO3U_07445 [Flavobacterium ponti]|uniref:Uncharacterized protein n=1 Tax=Flavobacterium ponti TaxID=665133 RepID=A0ABV9P6F1_9FLAO
MTLIRYELTTQEKQDLKNGLNIDLRDNIIITSSVEDNEFAANLSDKLALSQDGDCFTLIQTSCNGSLNHPDGYLPDGSNCPGHHEEGIWTFCNDNGSSSGGDTFGGLDTGINNNNTSGTQTSGSGGGGGNVTTSPVICKTCPEFDENSPCEKIKNGTSSAAYKQKFKALTNNYNLDHETGFSQVGSSLIDGTHNNNHQIIYPDDSKNGTHVHNNNIKTKSDGSTYDANVKMLSPKDLYLLMFAFRPNNPDPLDTFHIMQSNEGIFAITIIDIAPFTVEQRNFLFNWNKEFEEIAKEIIETWNTSNARKNALAKMFLNGLKEAGLEDKIAFFEGEIENASDTNINNYNIKWTRNKLKSTFLGTSIEKTDCN